jgi:hypothetical protein
MEVWRFEYIVKVNRRHSITQILEFRVDVHRITGVQALAGVQEVFQSIQDPFFDFEINIHKSNILSTSFVVAY